MIKELNKLSGSNGCLVAVIVLILVVLFLGINALIVMWLWNWVIVGIFGLKMITAWEALGLYLLSGMLFKSSVSQLSDIMIECSKDRTSMLHSPDSYCKVT